MSPDIDLLTSLLARTEDSFLDFKVQQYKLDTEWQKSGFIKDIVSMANTPRDESAYIVVGVAEEAGRATQIVGIQDHFDPSELDRQMEGRVGSVPSVEYHVIEHEESEIGIYEIKVGSGGPFVAQKKFGRLDPGTIYFRRNSQNVPAINSHDIDRISGWFAESRPSMPDQEFDASSWQQFHRACDGFDEERAYICVIDSMPDATSDDWNAFASMGWDLIVDFDNETDQSGGFAQSSDKLSKLRSLKFTPLDGDLPTMGPGATLWVAANGVSSRPTTVQRDGWREWNRSKREHLRTAVDTIAKLTGVKPTTLIVFGGEASYVRAVCEAVDSTFRDRVDFVFARPGESHYQEPLEMFAGSYAPMLFGEACRYIHEIRRPEPATTGIEIPKRGGGMAVIPPERARWIEEEFELIQLATQSNPEATQTEIIEFHQGMQVSWYGLNAGIDIRRDGLGEIERRVREGLSERSVRRIDLAHWPGGGGSTLGRRIAWNMRQTHPAVVAHTINPNSNLDRVRYLVRHCELASIGSS